MTVKCPECGAPCTARTTFDCMAAESTTFYTYAPDRAQPDTKLFDRIGERFKSGNSVPVERTYITRSEYDAIRAFCHPWEKFDEEVKA